MLGNCGVTAVPMRRRMHAGGVSTKGGFHALVGDVDAAIAALCAMKNRQQQNGGPFHCARILQRSSENATVETHFEFLGG